MNIIYISIRSPIVLESTIYIVFPYPAVGMIFVIYILSRSHKLAEADPAGTLESYYGTQNKQKNTQNTVIEV